MFKIYKRECFNSRVSTGKHKSYVKNAYIEVPVYKDLLDETVEEPFIVERW